MSSDWNACNLQPLLHFKTVLPAAPVLQALVSLPRSSLSHTLAVIADGIAAGCEPCIPVLLPWQAPTASSLRPAAPEHAAALSVPSTARRRTCMDIQSDHPVPLHAQAGSAELYLRDECGIPEQLVDAVLITAVAWRVTPGGRPLIDRRRRCRCERNMPLVNQYLQEHCNIPPGATAAKLKRICNQGAYHVSSGYSHTSCFGDAC